MLSMAPPQQAQEVLDFWFGAPGSAEFGHPRDFWFRKDPAFDRTLAQRFTDLHAAAARAELTDWRSAPESLVALIVVLDQFPRNIYRGLPASFATDAQALAAATVMVESTWDLALPPAMRWFTYMPFEHSELLVDQNMCLQLMQGVAEDPRFADVPQWAVAHHEVIARFGRFPHRNAILGRESTSAEVLFLSQPGSSF